MALPTPAPAFPVNDREYYPLHEEDDVPETSFHSDETIDLRDALRAYFPDRFVGKNICVYWIPGNTRRYRAPDVFVADGQPTDPQPRVYHTWQDPPILLAIEIGSRSTFRADEGPKQEIYEQRIRARAYLYANPPVGDLRLWQRGAGGRYEPVALEANGRVRLADLGLEFGIEAGHLRIYTLEGERLRTHDESESLLTVVTQQREEAEARASVEARQREEAEGRARAAEERAAAEQKQRAELERQLAELRARIQADASSDDDKTP